MGHSTTRVLVNSTIAAVVVSLVFGLLWSLRPEMTRTERIVAAAIRSLPDPGMDRWDEEVRDLLVRAYDADASGQLDAEHEVRSIPCHVLSAVNEGVKEGWGSSLRHIYGFKANLNYVGYTLGIRPSVRHMADAHFEACRL